MAAQLSKAARNAMLGMIVADQNKRTSDSKMRVAPAAQGGPDQPTHYFEATLLDTRGEPIGPEDWLLNMTFDQARDAFVNAERISLTVSAAHTVGTLVLSGDGVQVANIPLQQTWSVQPGDTVTFEPASVMINIPPGAHLEFPGLHVIEEEPSLYD